MNKTLTVFLLGVGAGILLAPDKGSVTIRKLRARLNELKDKTTDQADELIQKGREGFGEGREPDILD